jgi:hypothetical protein
MSQVKVRFGIAWPKFEGFLEGLDRLGAPTEIFERAP